MRSSFKSFCESFQNVSKTFLSQKYFRLLKHNNTKIFAATLSIIIEDENDNNPKFRRPFYRRSVTENSKNGVNIANIVADDADKNRSITYSLQGPKEITDLVHLDPETGEMVVANKIDREMYSWLNLTVKATDSGIPPR